MFFTCENMVEYKYDGYTLRLARAEDAENYYVQGFSTPDEELIRLTGSKSSYSKEFVLDFFLRSLKAKDRRWFLLLDPSGQIVGESLLMDIDEKVQAAHFRIALFAQHLRGKGLGTWLTQRTLNYAFAELHLQRVALEVFSFNPRAIRSYEKAGFQVEGRLRRAVKDGADYGDILLMAILREEWEAMQANKNKGA